MICVQYVDSPKLMAIELLLWEECSDEINNELIQSTINVNHDLLYSLNKAKLQKATEISQTAQEIWCKLYSIRTSKEICESNLQSTEDEKAVFSTSINNTSPSGSEYINPQAVCSSSSSQLADPVVDVELPDPVVDVELPDPGIAANLCRIQNLDLDLESRLINKEIYSSSSSSSSSQLADPFAETICETDSQFQKKLSHHEQIITAWQILVFKDYEEDDINDDLIQETINNTPNLLFTLHILQAAAERSVRELKHFGKMKKYYEERNRHKSGKIKPSHNQLQNEQHRRKKFS